MSEESRKFCAAVIKPHEAVGPSRLAEIPGKGHALRRDPFLLVGVVLRELAKPSKINGLQAVERRRPDYLLGNKICKI